jgi:hypothetical protein
VARIKERERSLKEEHIDGGYLVTLGTYIGPEDFNKPIVRQLQVKDDARLSSGARADMMITDRTEISAFLARPERLQRELGRASDYRGRPWITCSSG